jgi:hypothetical protein
MTEGFMMRNTIWSGLRVAALAAFVSLAFGSVAWAQSSWGQSSRYDDDDDYYRHDQARELGFKNGYRDGQRQGQSDVERGRRFKFKNDDWEDSRGFEHWMGNKGQYKQAYRDGYERAYRQTYSYYGDRYRNDYRYQDRYHDRDRDDWR